MLVTQSRPTLCDPMDCSLPGSSVYGILQARTLEWVAIPKSWPCSFQLLLSHVWLFATPWITECQASLSMFLLGLHKYVRLQSLFPTSTRPLGFVWVPLPCFPGLAIGCRQKAMVVLLFISFISLVSGMTVLNCLFSGLWKQFLIIF